MAGSAPRAVGAIARPWTRPRGRCQRRARRPPAAWPARRICYNALEITRSRLSELSLFFIFVLLWTRTLLAALLTPRRKEGKSNALTSLAGQIYHPRDGWRCPGW